MPVPYDEPGNVVWQTQIDAEPSAYARALADSLEGILGQGVHDIDGIVARLNDLGRARKALRNGPHRSSRPRWSAWAPENGGLKMSGTTDCPPRGRDPGRSRRPQPLVSDRGELDDQGQARRVDAAGRADRGLAQREGEVQVLADRCPHRGSRLSLGWNLGDRLACWYHGLEVGPGGIVEKVPAVGECPLVGTAAVKSYPCFEHMGGIFAYFGDDRHAEPVEFVFPEEFDSPEWDGILCTSHWRCSYRYAIDNVMDPMHGAYLHARSHSMAEGDKEARMRVRETDAGLIFEKVGQHGLNFDWGGVRRHRRPLDAAVAALSDQCRARRPVRDHGLRDPDRPRQLRVFFWRTRKCTGWERATWRFMYKHKLEALHWDVLEQDRVILERMPGDARDHEFLYQHDTGLARVRRYLSGDSGRAGRRECGREHPGRRVSAISLAGKRVLITGAARGLGRSFAEAALEAGARGGDRRHPGGRGPRRRRGARHRLRCARSRPARVDHTAGRGPPVRHSAGSTAWSTTRPSPPGSAARPARRSTSRPGIG